LADLARLLASSVGADHRNAPVNALSDLSIIFAVDDISERL
jgi:hypothetical protein